MSDNPLIMHPPRLSDLKGDALREALAARHAANKQRWLDERVPRGVMSRVRERLFG